MKNILLVACGSKFGHEILVHLKKLNCNINLITSNKTNDSEINEIEVNWHKLDISHLEKFLNNLSNLDFIFFNQNGTTFNITDFIIGKDKKLKYWQLQKHWSQNYFNSCILPFHIIQTLSKNISSNAKFCWMLSDYPHSIPKNEKIGHADYIGNKYQNFLIMKVFSKNNNNLCFFGVNPDSLKNSNYKEKAEKFIELVYKPNEFLNGKVFYVDGVEDHGYNRLFNLEI